MLSALRNASAGPSRLPLLTPSRNITSTRLPLYPRTFPLSTSQSVSPVLSSARGFSASASAGDKLKSHSGTKKRFFRTGGGLFKRGQAGKRHLNTLFSPGRINRLGRTAYASITQSKMLKKLLPYA